MSVKHTNKLNATDLAWVIKFCDHIQHCSYYFNKLLSWEQTATELLFYTYIVHGPAVFGVC